MKFCEKYVVESILSSLPPKSLMRFKCVSKQWYALINNPNFAINHLYNSMHENSLSTTPITRVLVKRTDENNTNTEVFSILDFCKDDDDVVNEHSFLATCEDVTLPMMISTPASPPSNSVCILGHCATCEDVTLPVMFSTPASPPSNSVCVVGHCNGIVCLAMTMSCEVLLWNPAIREVKALPTVPYVPDHSNTRHCSWCDLPDGGWDRFRKALGFGYCPKSNDYKVVNINIGFYEKAVDNDDNNYYYVVPKVAVYTLGGGTNNNSWRDSRRPYSLETESSVLLPERFQMCFKGMCFWIGEELKKEVPVFDEFYQWGLNIMIILLHMEDEVFEAIPLPDVLYAVSLELLVWNESFALFGEEYTGTYGELSFGIWVMDEAAGLCKGAWTKHVKFDLGGKLMAIAFLKSDEILMTDKNGCLFSYNLCTKNVKYFPDQRVSNKSATDAYLDTNKSASVVYLDSIVPLSRDDIRFKTGDSSDEHVIPLSKYSPSNLNFLTVDKEWHSYAVWAFPPDDVSGRIKKIMDGLRSEFPGPEMMEPHIPVLGSIHMTHDEVLSKFKSLQSCVRYSYTAKINEVLTRNFYYQRVSLFIDSEREEGYELWCATLRCGEHFGIFWPDLPRLSLNCGGYLSEDERKRARERVHILDGGITSLSFPITRLALYKIYHKDPTLISWEKIAEYPLFFH